MNIKSFTPLRGLLFSRAVFHKIMVTPWLHVIIIIINKKGEEIMNVEMIKFNFEGHDLVGRAYFDKKITPKKPLLILCHGIPRGDVSPQEKKTDGGYAALAEHCLAEGFPCFHFNFRGTGESGGNFDLSGWTRDLTAVLNYWEKRGLYNSFYLWGFSAGGAVSSHVASNDERVKATVLAASPAEFKSIFIQEDLDSIISRLRDTGILRDPGFPEDPRSWLEDIHAVDPLACIGRISPRPLFIVHGTGDDVVPLEHAHKLFAQAGEPKKLKVLEGAQHQLRKDEEAVSVCLEWLKGLPLS